MAVKGLWIKEIHAGKFKFGIGLLIMGVTAVAIPLLYDVLIKLVNMMPVPLGFESQINVLKNYEKYIWSQWFGKSLYQQAAVLAVIFGAGIISWEVSHKTVQFLLSRPVRREEIFKAKYFVGLGSLGTAMVISTLVMYISVLATGHRFPLLSLAQYLVLALAGVGVIFSFSVYYSTVFDQPRKSAVVSFVTALFLFIPGALPGMQKMSLYYHMSGVSLMEEGRFPILALSVMITISIVLYILGNRRFAKMDF